MDSNYLTADDHCGHGQLNLMQSGDYLAPEVSLRTLRPKVKSYRNYPTSRAVLPLDDRTGCPMRHRVTYFKAAQMKQARQRAEPVLMLVLNQSLRVTIRLLFRRLLIVFHDWSWHIDWPWIMRLTIRIVTIPYCIIIHFHPRRFFTLRP